MRVCVVVPAYQAALTLESVLESLRAAFAGSDTPLIVVDDGSTDATREVALKAGVELVSHGTNLGKGSALTHGMRRALELGIDACVTVDADGQHPAEEALCLARHAAPANVLVLGVRDLAAAGAPRKNRFSNAFSNRFLSWFSGRALGDTQCGLRRYPVRETLELGARSTGYAFEAEVILRAARAGWAIEQVPIRVIYPPESERITHFDSVKDPARIVMRVLHTVATARARR
jgi:glycosyltransferase involved in cell wall biosynthesis